MTARYRPLVVGCSGADVDALHARLLDLGAEIDSDELAAGFFGRSTRNALITVQQRLHLLPTGAADTQMVLALGNADAPHHCYVAGRVLGPDEQPVGAAVVHAFDRALRTSHLIGEAVSDDDGWYLIHYEPQPTGSADPGSADVYVRVLIHDRVVYDSPIQETIFNAPGLVSVTVRLPVRVAPERSEYERAVAAIEPLLGGLDWADLREDDQYHDVTFLAGESGLDPDQVTWVILANRLGLDAGIPPYFFYALFAEQTLAAAQRWLSLTPRLHLSISVSAGYLLNDVVLLPQADIEAAVRDATSTFLVPQRLADELPGILERLSQRLEQARTWAAAERQRVLQAQITHLIGSDLSDRLTAVLSADEFGDLPTIMSRLGALPLTASDPAADDSLGLLVLTELTGDDPVLMGRVRDRFGITGPATRIGSPN